MSKHWKPDKKTVVLSPAARPSRIRREPVQLNPNVPARPQRPINYREIELYGGIAGILVFAALIAAMIIGLAVFTVFRDDPDADVRALQFSQCYNAQGPNCVLDGGTIYVNQTTGGCQNAGRSGYIYVSELRGTTEQCRGDIGKVITSSGAFYAGSCGLGEFVPYSKPR